MMWVVRVPHQRASDIQKRLLYYPITCAEHYIEIYNSYGYSYTATIYARELNIF